jgi:hypothetical protein
MRSHRPVDDVTVLASTAEIPGLGHLPVNAFVLHAQEPVLVDAGLPADRDEPLGLLWSAVDPADLRHVWITHPDRNHTGALAAVLEAAPHAQLVTTFGGYALLSLDHDVPLTRLRLVNPGEPGRAQHLWAVADSPWVTMVDRARYATGLAEFAAGGLPLVLSTHLPPAHDLGDQLLATLACAPDVPPSPEPDQAALEAMLAAFAPEQRPPQAAAAPARA